MNNKLSARKERILVNLDRAEINALDGLAAESRRTRSNVLAVLILKANHDAQIKSVLGGWPMNSATFDQLGDGERIRVDIDWRLLNRLDDERSSIKDDGRWLQHLRGDGVLACPEDQAWFRENPQRRAYVRAFTDDEIDQGWLRLNEPEHLVLVKRIRVADNDRVYGPEAVMAAEGAGELVVVREPFKVHDIDEDLALYQKIEEVVGSEIFDTALRLWLTTSEIPQIIQPDGTFRTRLGPYLQYWRLDVIVEELYPGATQVLCPMEAPLA